MHAGDTVEPEDGWYSHNKGCDLVAKDDVFPTNRNKCRSSSEWCVAVGPAMQAGESNDDEDDELPSGESDEDVDDNYVAQPVEETVDEDEGSESSDSSDDDDNVTTTRSGRAVKRTARFIEEMGGVQLTPAEEQFYGKIFEGEVACVGAGLGGRFGHTSELHVMKYKQAMASPDLR